MTLAEIQEICFDTLDNDRDKLRDCKDVDDCDGQVCWLGNSYGTCNSGVCEAPEKEENKSASADSSTSSETTE